MKDLTQDEEKAALVAFVKHKVERMRYAIKQTAFESVRNHLEREFAMAEIALAALTAEPYCHAMERPSNGELVVVSAPRKGTFPLYRLPPAPAP